MNYYILKSSSQEKVCGVFPQVRKCSFNIKDIIEDIGRNKFPTNKPYLDHLILEDKAKLTSLLSVVYWGATDMYISKMLKETILKFNIHEYSLLSSKLLEIDRMHDYDLLHLTNKHLDGIDFDSSHFSIVNILGESIQDLENISKEKFHEEYNKNLAEFNSCGIFNFITATKIKLTKDFEKKKIDLLTFGIANPKIFVSEPLKNSIEKRYSGMRFIEQDIL